MSLGIQFYPLLYPYTSHFCKFLDTLDFNNGCIIDYVSNVNAEVPAPVEEKRLATWGTDVPDDLVLDQKKLADALKKVITRVFIFTSWLV